MSADPYRDWDAAYVLGALAPAERRTYEEHLTTCDTCRAAVAELAGIPGLLRQVPVQDVDGETPTGRATGTGAGSASADDDGARAAGGGDGAHAAAGDEVGGRGSGDRADVVPLVRLAEAARRRRRRTRAALVGAAAALVVVAGAAGAAFTGTWPGRTSVVAGDVRPDAQPDARSVVLAPVDGSGVSADLTIVPARWGTRLDWSCAYEMADLPEGVYELVLVDADGRRSVAATWTSTGERTATGLHASSALPLDGIARVELGVVGLERPLAAGEVT